MNYAEKLTPLQACNILRKAAEYGFKPYNSPFQIEVNRAIQMLEDSFVEYTLKVSEDATNGDIVFDKDGERVLLIDYGFGINLDRICLVNVEF